MKINGKSFYGYLFDDGLLLCTFYENDDVKEAKKFISAKLALATDLPDFPPGNTHLSFFIHIIFIIIHQSQS
jgi:hypothetical protein